MRKANVVIDDEIDVEKLKKNAKKISKEDLAYVVNQAKSMYRWKIIGEIVVFLVSAAGVALGTIFNYWAITVASACLLFLSASDLLGLF